MDDEVGAVGTAIFSRLTTGTVTSLVGTTGVYQDYGLRGATLPLVVFSYASERTEFLVNSKVVYQTWTVKGVSEDPGSDQAKRVMGLIDQDMHDAPLSITGGTLLHCRRAAGPLIFRDGAQTWHAGRNYLIAFETGM